MRTSDWILWGALAWIVLETAAKTVANQTPTGTPSLPSGDGTSNPTITLPPNAFGTSGNIVIDDSSMLQKGYACAWDNEYSSSVGQCYGWQAEAYFSGLPNFRWLDPSFGGNS